MSRLNYLVWFSAIILLASCWPSKNEVPNSIVTDTLTYTYQTFKERAADCGNKPDSGCTVVKIKYPVFYTDKSLNDTVTAQLLKLVTVGEKPDTSFENLSQHFITSYQDFKKQNPEAQLFFEMDTYANVIRQDSSLTTLEVGGYNFQGGAHGATFISYINWDTKAKKNLKLKDILKTGFEKKLNAVAEKIFRKNENLTDTSSLARDYFFTDARFALNDNFCITPIGLKFLYNIYEIKPYAAGRTELLVPYSQIRLLLKPKTVIAQYLK